MSEMFLEVRAVGNDKGLQASVLRAVDAILANHPALDGVQVEFKNVRTRVRIKGANLEQIELPDGTEAETTI